MRINFNGQKKAAVYYAVFFLFIYASSAYAQFGLTLTLESVQDNYIVREPVKFIVTLKNESNEILNYVGIRYLDMDMKYMYYEVINPLGERKLLKNITMIYDYDIIGDKWPGFKIRPYQRVKIFLYPNATRRLDRKKCNKITFPVPGIYRVRVVYSVPERFELIWKGEGGKLYSNQITLTFREPTIDEKEIFDAIWYKGGDDLSTGDDRLSNNFDMAELSAVIEKHKDNDLIKYAYFALAKQLINEPKKVLLPDAADYFELLREQYPTFRFEEVGKHLAYVYHNMNREEDAVRVLNETLRDRRWLKDNYNFMWLKVILESGRTEAVHEWLEKRREGRYCWEEEIRLEE